MLKDKVIVVAGGAGLLGQEICQELRSRQGQVIQADLGQAPDLAQSRYPLDITQQSSIKALIEAVVDHFGHLDGWVNCAYPRTADWGTPFDKVSQESLRANVDMHLNGYLLCCQGALEYMAGQGHGSLVNFASIYGLVGPSLEVYQGTKLTGLAEYAAIKGGLINVTRHLAAMYGPRGVRVNCLSPGGVFDNQDPIFVRQYESRVPLGRMAKPGDIAPSVAYLLSEDSRYVTGHNLVVDGGWTII